MNPLSGIDAYAEKLKALGESAASVMVKLGGGADVTPRKLLSLDTRLGVCLREAEALDATGLDEHIGEAGFCLHLKANITAARRTLLTAGSHPLYEGERAALIEQLNEVSRSSFGLALRVSKSRASTSTKLAATMDAPMQVLVKKYPKDTPVEIKEGPFAGFSGVSTGTGKGNRLRVLVKVFGRDTEVELGGAELGLVPKDTTDEPFDMEQFNNQLDREFLSLEEAARFKPRLLNSSEEYGVVSFPVVFGQIEISRPAFSKLTEAGYELKKLAGYVMITNMSLLGMRVMARENFEFAQQVFDQIKAKGKNRHLRNSVIINSEKRSPDGQHTYFPILPRTAMQGVSIYSWDFATPSKPKHQPVLPESKAELTNSPVPKASDVTRALEAPDGAVVKRIPRA